MSDISSIRRRVSLYAPLFLWIGIIFYLSGLGGSFDNTSKIIGPLLRFLFPDAPPETLANYHFFIRKCAHFTAYAILAFFAFRAFAILRLRAISSFAVVVVVAVLDEINQSFNTARTGSIWDVFLDLAGGTAMLVLLLAARRKSNQPEPRESVPE